MVPREVEPTLLRSAVELELLEQQASTSRSDDDPGGRDRGDPSRFGARGCVDRRGLPHEKLRTGPRREGAGVGVGDGSNEVVELARRAPPRQAAVLRSPTAERRRVRVVLGNARRRIGQERGKVTRRSFARGVAELPVEGERRIVVRDRDARWATMSPVSGFGSM
jgi:hypothetical protein